MRVCRVRSERCIKVICFVAVLVILRHLLYCGTSSTEASHSSADLGSDHLAEPVEIQQHYRRRKQDSDVNEQLLATVPPNDGRGIRISDDFFNYLVNNLDDAPFPGIEFYTEYTAARHGLKPRTNVKSLKPEFGPVFNDVTSFHYPIEMGPCQHSRTEAGSGKKKRPSLFVAVISAPGYFEKRESIRQTWRRSLFESQQDVDLVGFAFILGSIHGRNGSSIQEAIDRESATHRDIIQIDMLDSYHNLTLKVTALLNWADRYCQAADFVLKVDDDIYVNTRNLVSVLQPLSSSQRAVYGTYLSNTGTPLRNGKWAVSYETWPWSTYPPFLVGAGVLISRAAVTELLAAAQTTPFFVWDDLYVFGLCVKKAGVQFYTSDSMLDIHASYPLDDCFAYETVMWLTGSTEQMNASHTATTNFYRGTAPCVVQVGSGRNRQLVDHHKIAHFDFQIILR